MYWSVTYARLFCIPSSFRQKPGFIVYRCLWRSFWITTFAGMTVKTDLGYTQCIVSVLLRQRRKSLRLCLFFPSPISPINPTGMAANKGNTDFSGLSVGDKLFPLFC